jgi:hypothetical protein
VRSDGVIGSTLTAAYFNFVAAPRQTTISPLSFNNNSKLQFEKSFQKLEKSENSISY